MRTKSSIEDLYSATVWYSQIWFAVNPSRPSSRAFQENCPSNASIFVSLPVFLWFSAHSERYWAIWLQVNKALKVYKITKRRQNHKKKLELRPTFRPSNARIFAKIAPVFCLSFYKNVISVDQSWIRAGHIQGDVFEPFSGSGMAIGGRHRAPNWPKLAEGAIRHL